VCWSIRVSSARLTPWWWVAGLACLLVDPGVRGDEMACLANDLSELGHPVVAG
jgi:hypothetical protein